MARDELFDIRGDIINNDRGCSMFMTLNTPNSTATDALVFYAANSDPMMPSAPGSQARNAARSRHPQGVNAALCDGSIRFVNNGVALNAWMAAGTMNGGETIPLN
jgi:prepilin-type processing-associated H-X9-DG protein